MFLFLSDTCQALGHHVKTLWKIFSVQSLWKNSVVQDVSLRCVDSMLKTSRIIFAISEDLFAVIIACLQDIATQDSTTG